MIKVSEHGECVYLEFIRRKLWTSRRTEGSSAYEGVFTVPSALPQIHHTFEVLYTCETFFIV